MSESRLREYHPVTEKAANPFLVRAEGPDGLVLERDGHCWLRIGDGGRVGRVSDRVAGELRGEVARWGAPYALALRGQVMLHSSAARRDGRAAAFLGASGAGKSTLCRELANRGWQPICDDLVLCDPAGRLHLASEAILRRWLAGLASSALDYADLARQLCAEPSYVPVQRLFFLDLPRADRFLFTPLAERDVFFRLLDRNFLLPCKAGWANQFPVYGGLARGVRAGTLRAPEGVERMRQQLAELEALVSGEW